jgi:hypothetical protein
MMKRLFTTFLCALLLLAVPALAQEGAHDKTITHAKSLLTEVFGYTQQEADAFEFTVTETDTQWLVEFSPKEHPEWIYTGAFNKADDKFAGSSTPFHTSYNEYPGENGIRDTLRDAEKNHWFSQWNDASKAAFGDKMQKMNISINYALQAGLTDKNYTAAQALDDFFFSCYGERYMWSPAVYQWRDEVLKANSLSLVPEAFNISTRQGIHTRTVQDRGTASPFTATEFLGEIPPELTQAFTHPKLEGWTSLCGAVLTADESVKTPLPEERGLAAFAKGDERLLVALYRESPADAWSVSPVGVKALFPNRDFFITYDGQKHQFVIEYPISGFESESFGCEFVFMVRKVYPQPMCRLIEYRRSNRETGSGVIIDSDGGQMQAGAYWYHVITYQPGSTAKEEIVPAIFPGYLDYVDAAQFPKSAEECHTASAQSFTLPDGYGVTQGVHLRAETSSHSADLGMYEPGTLVQVLETLPGDPYPWYRVRVGLLEGYMSSTYVTYGSSADIAGALLHKPLNVAKAKKACALKKGTGWLDGPVMDITAGTKMHVIATCGDWLHVVIPQGEIGWAMDVKGTYGYVKASDVVQAGSSIQLDWME